MVIDAGHGGKDPGAVGKLAYEKDIALNIALKVGKYIETTFPEMTVLYTRKTDVFIELHKRADIANKAKADLFISVHVNAHPKPVFRGTSTYVMGLSAAQENIDVAKRENSVITIEKDYKTRYDGFDPDSPETDILLSLMQNSNLEQSSQFAAMVQQQFRQRAKRHDMGVRQAALLVLYQTTMPSVLVETGFISNPTEERFLITEKAQDLLASAIFRAFRNYKFMREGKHQILYVKSPFKITFQQETPPSLPDTKPQEKKQNTPPESSQITFRVQVGSSPKALNTNNPEWKQFGEVLEYRHKGSFKYAVGKSSSFEQALALQRKVRQKVPGAFVIALKGKQRISTQKARKMLQKP